MFEGILQPTHLLIILAICLLLFGPQKLPQLGKGLGESIKEFKKAMSEATGNSSTPTTPTTPTTPVTEEKK
ncbi:MAG: twin-arginine translocase TatA/TatE family subunit [Terriglobales bacterium]